MIRKFSITNCTQLLTSEEQQRLSQINRTVVRQTSYQTGSDISNSWQRNTEEKPYYAIGSLSTALSKYLLDSGAGDYEELLIQQTDDEYDSDGKCRR
ncbi:hypothetical protein EB796_019149 [Bugula neritina]|uniref:Uncharacterized protein n=1 Tax=Bugula neritina TaxID=10212 RepID=A0A7J7J928_BUGNE|nr:hypothetical protein EB796_019737 [Bugula neritina]KAF6022543.1 hypothetical protein EB796_019149 [Bugula neritina]